MKTKLILIVLCLFYFSANTQNWFPLGMGTNINNPGAKSLITFDNKLFIGGRFTLADNHEASGVAYYDYMGWHSDEVFNNSFRYVKPFGIYKDDLYGVANYHYHLDSLNEIIVLDKDNYKWNVVPNSKLKQVLNNGNVVDGIVWDIISYKNNIFIGGEFDSVGNVYAKNIARWDGKNWYALTDVNNNTIHCEYISDFEIYKDELYMTGKIDSLNEVEFNDIAKWNGSNWDNVNGGLVKVPTGVYWHIFDMEVYKEELYIGGKGSFVNENEEGYKLLKWNGEYFEGIQYFIQSNTDVREISGLGVFGDCLFIGAYPRGQTFIFNDKGIKKLQQELGNSIVDFEVYDGQLYAGGGFQGEDIPNGIAKLGQKFSTSSEILTCMIFPNPSDGNFILSYEIPNTSNLKFKLFDITGKKIFDRIYLNQFGSYYRNYSFQDLAAGMYLINLEIGDYTETKKIIIAKK